MRKAIPLVMALLLVLLLAGCCAHDWQTASCTEAKTCAKCGETEGEALGHDWQEATCADPKTCARCGKTWGEVLDHEAGEWQIEEEADFRSVGLRVRSCIYCGEWMEEEEYYRPVYEDGLFVVSADELARLIETEGDDMVTAAAVDEDGAVYILLETEGEEAATIYFLNEKEELAATENTEDVLDTATIVISVMTEEVDVRNPALEAAVLACQNGEDRADADERFGNIEYALATGDLYRCNGAAYFWGSYGDDSALYIGVGEVEALYDERAIIPYFDFTFEEFVDMFNAAPEDVNGGWSIERLEDGSFAMYNIDGGLAGGIVGLDYTEEEFETSDAKMAPEKFNELLIVLVASPEDDEDGQGLLATAITGSLVGLTIDESFTPAYFLNECAGGSIGRGAWRGNDALVCETEGYRYSLSQSGVNYYIFLIQKLQG